METSRCENFLISDRLTSHFSFQLYATALSIEGENISYRPLRIGYADGGGGQDRRRKKSYIDNLLENVNSRLATGRNKRSTEDEIDVEGRVSYIAMEYIKFFTDKIRNRNLSQEETQSELVEQLQSLDGRLSGDDELSGRVSRVLAARLTAAVSR